MRELLLAGLLIALGLAVTAVDPTASETDADRSTARAAVTLADLGTEG